MRITSIERITDFPHLNMFNITYIDTENREKVWRLASRNPDPKCLSGRFDVPDAVIIVPFHTGRDRLVIIREFRVSLDGYQYGFPAGLVDSGETVEAAAGRELKEETGLDVARLIRVSPPIYSSSGMTDESIAMAYVDCVGTPSRDKNEGSEDIETLLVSPSEATAICADEKLKVDAKTWLVLAAYGATGRVVC
jgi:ADP-ribose pyrophosphatase